MNESTLEQYFIEDYKRLKAENDELKVKLAAFEANAGNHEYGITDLHQRFKAVKGNVISEWNLRYYGFEKGNLKVETAESLLKMDDDELFKAAKQKSVDYTRLIKFEEHEFQYTLMVKESRTEWVAHTDGEKGSALVSIEDDGFCEDCWTDADYSEELKKWLCNQLRSNLRDAIARYEEEQAKKDGGDGE